MQLVPELSGEDETWLSTVQFTLSGDGSQLIDNMTVRGTELARYKCPGVGGTRPNKSFKPTPLRGAT